MIMIDHRDADSVATYARALNLRGKPNPSLLWELWLMKGQNGWGLPYAWDAFQDGTVNPITTAYGYTTALAGLALVESGNHFFAQTACDSLDRMCERRGAGEICWYSDHENDQKRGLEVVNICALAMLLRKKLGRNWEPLYKCVIPYRHNYRWDSLAPNDTFHQALIVEAIAEVDEPLAIHEWHRMRAIWSKDPGSPMSRGVYDWGASALVYSGAKLGIKDAIALAYAEQEVDVQVDHPYGASRRWAWQQLALAAVDLHC